MAHVKLFGLFRHYAGKREAEVPGGTVRAVLEALCADNTRLQEAVMAEAALRPYVRVVVNGHAIELAQGLETALAPGDEVAIFSPVAGG